MFLKEEHSHEVSSAKYPPQLLEGLAGRQTRCGQGLEEAVRLGSNETEERVYLVLFGDLVEAKK